MLDQGDLDAVRALQRPGRPDILQQLLRTYLASSAKLIEDLKAAAAAQDYAGLRMGAHSLKSSSRSLGARQLADLCQALEKAAEEQLPEDCARLCALVIPEYDVISHEMRGLLVA
jgi:HPt (histidine-containing phosphotransfer) domain-containing protein